MKTNSSIIRVSDEVRDALASHRAVVALESTIFSHLGLPSPANAQALTNCIAAIREAGAVPAITAVIDGVARVGINESEHERNTREAMRLPFVMASSILREDAYVGRNPAANASPAPVVSTILATGGVATSVITPAAVTAVTGSAPRLITVSAAPGIGCAESMLSNAASSLLHRNTSGARDAISEQ